MRAYRKPPIVEVVLGVLFEPLPGLDPMMLGRYWAERNSDFPRREMRPAVHDQPVFVFGQGVAPLRCWLISEDDQFVLQAQQDRFYFNWRKRGAAYPRFGDHDGNEGLCTKALREFDTLLAFCDAQLSKRPEVRRLEVMKVDQLVYTDAARLVQLIKPASLMSGYLRSSAPELEVRVGERADDVDMLVHVTTAVATPDLTPAVRVELKASVKADAISRQLFERLEGYVDAPFDEIFTEQARQEFEPLEG